MRKKIKIKALVAGDAGGANKIIKKIKITDKGYRFILIQIKIRIEIKAVAGDAAQRRLARR